uniref:Uncharacterized protein n=1 Tax=Tanacetum cinerariifolium TaxID=118510 RepID=A0A6L2MEL7_TANCI|nr:hypothetical protein [Tanacetum cinerariifolium]
MQWKIPHGFSLREPTFQVVLDALALTPCYPTFLITAYVPEVYMHQFWNCIYKHDDFYRFKIDKKKRFKLTLEVFRDILQICPRVQGSDFDPLPSEEDIVSFLRDLGHTGVINSLNDTSGLDKLRLSRAQIIWELKESKAYKTYLGYATGTVPPKVARKFKKASPSKEYKNVDVARRKGIDLLSEVALIEEAQMKEVRKKSLREFHKSHPGGSGSVAEKPPSVEKITPPVTNEGTGDKPGVPDVTKDGSTESESESWGNNYNDSNNEEGNDDDDDEVKDDDIDVEKSKGDEDKGMDSDDVQDKTTDKTKVPVTSSSRSSALASKFINFSDIPPVDTEIVSPLDVHVHHERSRDDKDKDEGPYAGSDRGLKKRKTSKDAEPTTSPKTKDPSSRSSKGTKSQPKSSVKSTHAEEPEFKVGDTDTPQDKAPQKGPTQNWLMTLAASTSTGKSLKEFDELMSIPIDFFSYILNGLKIKNLTQEILLLSSLEDITKNIDMEYLPKRRWSTLKEKRSHYMIKDINKLLKERRMMRSLENQNQRDLPRDIPLDSVVVLRYEKKSISENKGRVPTEMELVLEQTQQGTSYEVLISDEGVEELKGHVRIKGEKKEPPPIHLGRN